jgi:drug/metabolite transporter (DMT)-like permease
MGWQVFISVQLVLVALATIVTRLLARDKRLANSGFAITAGWFVVLYTLGLLALPKIGHIDTSAFHHYGWRFIGGGIAFTLTNIFFFYMLKYLDAAIGTILGTISAIFTVFGAYIFLHENLTDAQIVGTCILIASVIYGSLATRHRKHRAVHINLAIGASYALIGALFYAVAAINEKSLLGHMTTGTYVLFGWGCQTLIAVTAVLLIQPKSLKSLLRPNVAGWTFVLGVLRAVSGYCFMLSLVKSNNVGLVTVISNFKLILIVLLGAWLLNERNKMAQKLIAAAGAMVALSLLFWS